MLISSPRDKEANEKTCYAGTLSYQQKRAVGNVKLKESLDYSVHEIVEFKILRTVRGMHNKLTALDFRRRNCLSLQGSA